MGDASPNKKCLLSYSTSDSCGRIVKYYKPWHWTLSGLGAMSCALGRSCRGQGMGLLVCFVSCFKSRLAADH